MNKSIIALITIVSLSATAQYSTLWGKNGETWDEKRISDFSYAGYHRGEKHLPRQKPTTSVKKFGAKGDGKTDDTTAFQKALDEGGVIAIPSGKYIISNKLHYRKSGTVLMGKGEETVLFINKTLTDIKPNWSETTSGKPTSAYSWSGGFISMQGKLLFSKKVKVLENHKRGQRVLTLLGHNFIAGELILLTMRGDTDKTLLNYLYAEDAGDTAKLVGGRARVNFVTKVKKVKGDKVYIDRALNVDIRPEWQPTFQTLDSSLQECGLQNIKIEFPVTPYKGHFSELGYNALVFGNSMNCWLKNITIKNCDSGIFMGGYHHTIDGLRFVSERPADSRGYVGHHGFNFNGNDSLLKNFEFEVLFYHDITPCAFSSGNVAMKGKSINLSIDHHKRGPNNSLFTEIEAGKGDRLYKCGGGASLGKNAGAWMTYWNISSQNRINPPPINFCPGLFSFIGVNSLKSDFTRVHFEAISPKEIIPKNLYEEQLRKRLRK